MEKPQILVVDDKKRAREAIIDGLGKTYEMHEASNGAEALAILPTLERLRVVLSDNDMPEMEGIELLQRIRERDEEIKRVLTSGRLDATRDAELFVPAAPHLFLPKPLSIVVLRQEIQKLLETVRQ